MFKLQLFIAILTASATAAWADITTGYTTSGCKSAYMAKTAAEASYPEDTLNKEILFQSDTITMRGRIYANCCGTHLLSIAFSAGNLITLTRSDTGMLCACHCPFDFMVRIPVAGKDTCRIHLVDYFGDSLDTVIYRGAPVAIGNGAKKPVANVTRLTADAAGTMFDIRGRRLITLPAKSAQGVYLSRSAAGKQASPFVLQK